MNGMKFTPGPWIYVYSGTSLDLKGNNGNTLIAEFPTLAKEDGTAYRPSDEDAANLRLIAQAPAMFEALKAIDELVSTPPLMSREVQRIFAPHSEVDDYRVELCKLILKVKDHARTAINAVEGQTKEGGV